MRKRRSLKRVNLGEVTKKDFVALSKILCRNSASPGLVDDLANYFGSQNPRFDKSRFVRATEKC